MDMVTVFSGFCYNHDPDDRRWALTEAISMARKAGKKAGAGGPRKYGTLVRLADDVAADAKVVASIRNVSMAEYLSDTLRPLLKRALTEELRKRVEGQGR
jgi:hypothetical protein